MKNSVLSQILEQAARARCKPRPPATPTIILSVVNSIALVKPDKAKSVEMMLIRMAQSGQISGKVSVHSQPLFFTVGCRWAKVSWWSCLRGLTCRHRNLLKSRLANKNNVI